MPMQHKVMLDVKFCPKRQYFSGFFQIYLPQIGGHQPLPGTFKQRVSQPVLHRGQIGGQGWLGHPETVCGPGHAAAVGQCHNIVLLLQIHKTASSAYQP